MDIPYRLPALAISIVALVGATACSHQVDNYSDLSEDSDNEKPLPDTIREEASVSLDLDSARWVGEHEGTELWLGLEADDMGICLVVYPDDERWVSGCSTAGEVIVSNGDGWDYRAHPDNADLPEGAIQVSRNVFVTQR